MVTNQRSPYVYAVMRQGAPMCNKLRELCFIIGMVDDSALYIALADSAVYDIGRCRERRLMENPYALKYYTASLRLISQQIQTVSSICNGTIAVVAATASYDVRPPCAARFRGSTWKLITFSSRLGITPDGPLT